MSNEALWNLMNDFEDYIKGGIKSKHEEYNFSKIEVDQDNMFSSEYIVSIDENEKNNILNKAKTEISNCTICRLSEIKKGNIYGKGSKTPKLMIIDSTFSEDTSFLEKWLGSIGLNLISDCYYSSIIKCKTDEDSNNLDREFDSCFSYLEEQIQTLSPNVILLLGKQTTQSFNIDYSNIENNISSYNNIPLIFTHHPTTVLEDSSLKRKVWEDLKKIKTMVLN